MYTYIIDIRYKKNAESEDPYTVHNYLEQTGYELKTLHDSYERTEVLVKMNTIAETGDFAKSLNNLKQSIDSDCTIDCYIVSNKWSL